MKVLVTGGAGYVGSHVVREMVALGHRPLVVDNLSKGHRQALPETVELVEADLADGDKMRAVFSAFQPEAVMHFAGSTQVAESTTKPGLYFQNNFANGIRLLDLMVECGVKMIVFSSTAAVYGEPQETPIPEEHPTNPVNPYGESKLFFEKALARYEAAYGLRYAALRYFNAAGAHPSGEIGEDHDPESHLIPIVIQAALGRRPAVTIYGTDYPTFDGTCVRDYVHVCDLAAAHLLVLEDLAGGGESAVYNLGNGRGFSVREVVEAVKEVVGWDFPVKEGERRAGDPAVLVAGAKKIRQKLGWEPRYPDLREIIETAWRWHSRHPAGFGGGQ
ncbi:MAG TPA: UDP-glucose 4-epimerase GalE [Firmicutes bacterium]|nr:UDP-glucose 4-epimerase GalE [Bacillota bacterium]